MKKRNSNKGFSLVELIVVIAIMAVLIGVLAPTFVKYIGQSQESKKETNGDTIISAVNAALSDREYVNAATKCAAGHTVTITPAATEGDPGVVGGTAPTNFLDLVKENLGNLVGVDTVYKVTLKQDASGNGLYPEIEINPTAAPAGGGA